MNVRSSLPILILVSLTPKAMAAITTYTDFGAWQSAVGSFTTIGFTEYPTGTIVTDQYAASGVIFPDGNDFVRNESPVLFPQDGAGLVDNLTGVIRTAFDTRRAALAVHYPGIMIFRLFSDGEVIAPDLQFVGGGGTDNFAAVTSTIPFDFVLRRPPLF